MRFVINILTIIIFATSVFAKSFLLSPLPIPTAEVIDIDINDCNKECLLTYLENGEVFSFLAKASINDDEYIKENFQLLTSILNIKPPSLPLEKLKIALILPTKKIGKYAISTTKSVIAYLISKNVKFKIKTFEIEDENIETLQTLLDQISNENFEFIIAPLTLEGAKNLALTFSDIKIYIPTINRSNIDDIQNKNITFGGIDYKKQIDSLINYANNKMVIFYESNSPLALKLTKMVENSEIPDIKTIEVKDEAANLKRYFYKNEDLNSSTIFLNTPIVKSSLILSQLTLYDLEPQMILSTQINYTPLIFSLTQYKDRKNLLIANSIHSGSNYLEEINSLLNNDITFNWINYSTSIGIDYFYNQKSNEKRIFNEKITKSQVDYQISIEKASYGKFKTIEESFEIDQETHSE